MEQPDATASVLEVPAPLIEKPETPASDPELPEVLEDHAVKEITTEEAAINIEISSTAEVAHLDMETFEAQTERKEVFCISDTENSSLDLVLAELCKEMQEIVASAVSEYEASSEAMVNHINLMQKVMEHNLTSEDDSVWNEMFLAAQAKSDKAKAAEITEKEALTAITNVVESISAERKDKVTFSDPDLLVVEEAVNRAIFQMDQAKTRRAALQNEAMVMEEYQNLVEAGRKQFHMEMASIMPDVKLGEKNGKLTEYELNMFITHAYKKVLFLQQEVAKQQTLEQARFKRALEKQTLEVEIRTMEKVEVELERQARELLAEHEEKMAYIREEAEGQLRAHLRRQAAAHTDHLTDLLTIQETELTRQHQNKISDQVDSLTKTHMDSLASLSGTMSGLTEALEARAASDSASLSAQTLWLACSRLNTTINTGQLNATTWEEKLQPICNEVEQVKMAAGPDNKFVEVVLDSISPLAMERGVYTEDSLIERFCDVEKIAKRVAGIGEEGGSLLAFGLSYLQSLLVVDLGRKISVNNVDEMDLVKVSPTDLINMAKHNLERGNLASAVQLMTQLEGEPGRVAADWVAEARLTLETRQAVQAIQIHSLANSCKYMPDV